MSILLQNRARAAAKKAFPAKQPCERCGKSSHVVRHHEDYSKPLEIVWLCRSCHAVRHCEMQAGRIRHPLTNADMNRVFDLHVAGNSPSAIVDVTGICQAKVYELLRFWRKLKAQPEGGAAS